MIRNIAWKFDEDLTWFWSGLNLRLGGWWGFLTRDLEDGVISDMEDILRVWWRSIMIKQRKSYSLVGLVGLGWLVGLVFVKYKDLFNPIKKPTNLDPTPGNNFFLSLIMSGLHQTFRISSISSTNMIYYIKDDPLLQVSSQEPSTSAKSEI